MCSVDGYWVSRYSLQMTQKFCLRQSRLFPLFLITVLVFLASSSVPAHAAPGDGHWDRQFGTPGTASRNFALRFNGNSLYTGGYSVAAGQVATNTVVNVFDGTNWTSLGEITGGLTALYVFAFLGNDLYVGGLFQRAGDVPAVGLAKWDGANWSDVGGFSGVASSLAADGTNLYVSGTFTNCGGISITNVAKWNGANWSALGDGVGYLRRRFIYDRRRRHRARYRQVEREQMVGTRRRNVSHQHSQRLQSRKARRLPLCVWRVHQRRWQCNHP